MQWSELSADLQTGDIILFHQSGIISRLIDLITDANYSHVGMVVRQPDGALHFWQSFEPEGGVVYDALPEFLYEYQEKFKGRFVARRLLVERTPKMWVTLEAFLEAVKGRPFPSIFGMLMRWIEGRLGIDSGEDKFFCSDLVADSYMKMGLFPEKPPPNFYAPKNFATSKDLHFLLGAKYTERIPIELPPKKSGEPS